MKKILAKLGCLILIMCIAITSLVGCSDSDWEGDVTLTNAGNIIENGGAIAETDNYLYFINGLESTTANNKMGNPLKGALLVVNKEDLLNADEDNLPKTEVVVPKLMVASDYNAGVFIDGGYAYYATPSVEKNSQGNVANDELTFMRTKLDGSGKTDEYFTLDSKYALATEYRIVKGENGGVFIYYYDEDNSAIVCYNTSTKKASTIIKQSEVDNGDSLSAHFFLKSQDINQVVGYYTTNVYEEKHQALYNRVYLIKAGSTEGELLIDGQNVEADKGDDYKYSITLIKDGFVFFTKTNSGITETFALKEEDARIKANWEDWDEDTTKITKIVNTEYVLNSTLIVSLDEIYVLGETKVYKTTFIKADEIIRKPIALKENINKLLFIRNEKEKLDQDKKDTMVDYLYFYDGEGNIAKFSLAEEKLTEIDKTIIYVSADTADTAWYDIEIKTIENKDKTVKKDYLFYCDNSVMGRSYIKYVELDSDIVGKNTDDDDEDDIFYLDTDDIKVLGIMTNADSAVAFDAKVSMQAINAPADGIGANADDDGKFQEVMNELIAEYEAMSSAVKDLIPESAKNTLVSAKKAFEVVEKYQYLDGIANVGSAQEAEEQGFKAKYEEIKAYMEEFKNSDLRDGVDAIISNNLKANYTKAVDLFEVEE